MNYPVFVRCRFSVVTAVTEQAFQSVSKHGALRPQKPYGLLGTGRWGGGGMEVGEREIVYLSLHCHHQNDFCIKMGSDESHFNVCGL